MSVTREEVAKIASLARIKMGDAELDTMVPELNNILDWVEQLGEVDCSGVEPMTAVIPNTLRLRDDVVDAWGVLKHRMSYLSWLRTRCSRRVLRIVHLGP